MLPLGSTFLFGRVDGKPSARSFEKTTKAEKQAERNARIYFAILGAVKLAKKKKPNLKLLKKKLWLAVSKRIKERDGNICFTSKKRVEGMNAHCGHGLPASICGGRLKYHPKNLHCQSYNENINLGGNGTVYYQEQVKKYGQEAVDKLYALRYKPIKVDAFYYAALTDLYQNGTWKQIEDFLSS